MHGGLSVGKNEKQKPVVIAHLRLDADLAGKPPVIAGGLYGWTLEKGGGVWIKDQFDQRADIAEQRKRIKAINAFLGSRENALAELKLKGSPMALLIEKASAKGEELQAAQDIEQAWFALAGALMFKPLTMEKTSPSRKPDWSPRICQSVEQYQAWANHWSVRRKTHLDHTLECVISAVIDQRPIRTIAGDLGFDFRKIERAVLGGLRDYAARAGWVDGKLARAWMDAAELTFARRKAA